MKSVYLIDLGTSEHILFTEEKVLVNLYADSSEVYDAFESGMDAIAEVSNIDIVEVTMSEEDCNEVSEMFMDIGVGGPTNHVVEYILKHAVKEG